MVLRTVNLIPTDILTRRYLLRHLGFWAGCLIVPLSLILGFYFYQTRYVLSKKSALTNLQSTYTNLGSRIEEIKRVQKEIERLAQQQSTLKAMESNLPYSRVLLKLADIMNEYTWLTQLAVEADTSEEGEQKLKLIGFSLTNTELGDFLDRLAGETMFRAIELKYARDTKAPSDQKEGGPKRLIQFQIECNISRE